MCIRLPRRTIAEVSAGLFTALFMIIAFEARQPEQSLAGEAPERLSVFEHQTDFLTIDECTNGLGTTFYPEASPSSRRACREALKARGYRHIYLSVASSSYNLYDNAPRFRRLLEELKEDGIEPVVWLTSDSGRWRNRSMDAIQSDLEAFIPEVDDLVDSYCLGIEIDEYWSENEADQVAEMLKELSRKKVAFHQSAARWDYCQGSDHCDYMILQYGFGLSTSEIRRMTRRAVRELDRPVVAGEYNRAGESASRRLGTAAVEAGASGFGNGGEPF